jgi:hypothetical protein
MHMRAIFRDMYFQHLRLMVGIKNHLRHTHIDLAPIDMMRNMVGNKGVRLSYALCAMEEEVEHWRGQHVF